MAALREWCKAGVTKGLFHVRLLNPVKRGRLYNACGVVLQYHSVSPAHSSHHYIDSNLSISPEDFERQIAFVSKYFRVVSLDQLLAHARERRTRETLFAVTFDDGYRDNYVHAFPILRKYNAPATFYLTTECIDGGILLWTSELRYLFLKCRRQRLSIPSLSAEFATDTAPNKKKSMEKIKRLLIGKPRYDREAILAEIRCETRVKETASLKETMLTWEQVKTMHRAGMDFGSHTLSHPSLPYIPPDEAKREIVESRASLMARLDCEISQFSFPNPCNHINFNSDLKQMLKDAGYGAATTSCSGYVSHGYDPFELKRKGIYGIYSALPDFYRWLIKDAFLQRWKSFVGTERLN